MQTEKTKISSGFTMTEVLVVIGVIALVVVSLLPALVNARARSKRIDCVSHLKNIGLSRRTFAVDYGGQYPWNILPANGGFAPLTPSSTPAWSNNVYPLFAAISNELSTPGILICPSDTRNLAENSWAWVASQGIDASQISSYFIGASTTEEQPQSILGGDRNLLIPSLGLDFKTAANYNKMVTIHPSELSSTNVGWSREMHHYSGNLLLGDGSVQQVSGARGTEMLNYAQNVFTNGFELFFPAL